MVDTPGKLCRKAKVILRTRAVTSRNSPNVQMLRLIEELQAQNEHLRQACLLAEQSKHHYIELYESGPWGCINTDHRGVITRANDAALETLGLQPAELEERRMAYLVDVKDQPKYFQLLSEIATGRDHKQGVELRLLKRFKEPAYVQLAIGAFSEAGRFVGWRLTFLEIHQQKLLEEELRRSKDKYSSIFQTTRDAIIVCDAISGRIVEANPSACDFYGYAPHEMLLLTHLDLSVQPAQALQAISRESQTLRHCYHKRKDGTVFPAEISLSYFTQQGHRMSTMVIRDITQCKQAEQDLQENNAALKVLLKQREQDRVELEDSLLDNVQRFVLPYLERLEKSRLEEEQKRDLELVASHLRGITSPFVRNLTSRFLGLTPTELRVAELIRQGRTSKEIAETLLCSERTVLFHRQNIRKKLGLNKQKANLQAYLVNLS